MTSQRFYSMKLKLPFDTFYDMVWESPGLSMFLKCLKKICLFYNIFQFHFPHFFFSILSDLCQLKVHEAQKSVFLAGLIAATKMISTRRKLQLLTWQQRLLIFMNVVYLELSTARTHKAKEDVV